MQREGFRFEAGRLHESEVFVSDENVRVPQGNRLYQINGEDLAELERLEAPTPAIHYCLTVLLAQDGLTWGMVAQRVRRAKERRQRIRLQAAARPELKSRCIAAYVAACAYCGRAGTPSADPDGSPWALDRIVPRAHGGEYEPSNVALACTNCNKQIGANFTLMRPPSLAQLEAA